jgi:hypothetical protein
MKMRKKADLPSKLCQTCGLPFNWRKKWEKTGTRSNTVPSAAAVTARAIAIASLRLESRYQIGKYHAIYCTCNDIAPDTR